MQGILRVTVLCGHFVKDADLIGKMDPFVVLEVGTIRERTKTKHDAGVSAIWNEEFVFVLTGQNEMFVKCYDEDPHSDEHIGEARVFLKQFQFGAAVEKDFPLTFQNSNKHAGVIALKIELDYRSDTRPEDHTGWAQPTQPQQVVKGPGYVPKGQFGGFNGFQPPSYSPQNPPF